jgi:hypothetical protein
MKNTIAYILWTLLATAGIAAAITGCTVHDAPMTFAGGLIIGMVIGYWCNSTTAPTDTCSNGSIFDGWLVSNLD